MLALYDWGSAPCREFREALSFSPSAAGVCLPMSPISLVLMLPLWYYLVVCALSTPLAQQNQTNNNTKWWQKERVAGYTLAFPAARAPLRPPDRFCPTVPLLYRPKSIKICFALFQVGKKVLTSALHCSNYCCAAVIIVERCGSLCTSHHAEQPWNSS